MKQCSKCNLLKNETEYFVKDSSTKRLHAQCKQCYKDHRKSYYTEHYMKYSDKYRERARLRRHQLRDKYRNYMVNYLAKHPCSICGESDICVLEFDHLDPSLKSFSISQAISIGRNWQQLLDEVKKCRVLCANCHKRHTATQAGWYKNIGGTYESRTRL